MSKSEYSKKPYPNIIVVPPGPKARNIIKADALLLSPSTQHLCPLVVDSAKGCILKDVDGNEFIDFSSASGIVNVGYNHPHVIEASKAQIDKALHYGYGTVYYEEIIRLSEVLTRITPGEGEKRICYSNSGSEAIETGMKVAAWHTRGQTFFSFIGASHGRTLGALSLSCANIVHKRYFPASVRVVHIPFPYCYRCPFKQTYSECDSLCINVLEDHLKLDVPAEEVAALAIEPIQGEGCIIPPQNFFKRLGKLIREYDLLLIDDEVLTGLGRTGRWFAIENWEITPDIICLGGSLSSGLPIGVTVAKKDVMDWEPDSHASTLGGNPVSCAAASATIEVIYEEHLLENAVKQGAYLLRCLQELAVKYPILGDVRGKGLLLGVEIVRDPKTREPYTEGARQIALKSLRRGVLLQVLGASTMRLCPPLNISQNLIDASLNVLETAISEVSIGV